MPNIAFINSKYVEFKNAKVHIEDRGFQFADSVYEVLKIINKKLIDFDYHFKRLKYSSSELSFNLKIDKDKLHRIFLNLIKKNNLSNGIIYMQITRGVQPRDHAYKKNLFSSNFLHVPVRLYIRK